MLFLENGNVVEATEVRVITEEELTADVTEAKVRLAAAEKRLERYKALTSVTDEPKPAPEAVAPEPVTQEVPVAQVDLTQIPVQANAPIAEPIQ